MHVKVLLRRLQNRWMRRTRTSAPMPLDQQVIDAADLLIDEHHLELASELRGLLPYLRGRTVNYTLENAVANLLTSLEWAEYDPDNAETAKTRARIALVYDVATARARQADAATSAVEISGRRRVCISGSMRFADEMRYAAADESLTGRIVLMPHVDLHHGDLDDVDDPDSERAEQLKSDLDELHIDKIDLADEVLVICPGGYIGDSTRCEIEHAERHGKPVRYWPAAPTQHHTADNGVPVFKELV